MSIYKHGKLFAVSAVMLLGLVACNTNNDEAIDLRDNQMTSMGNKDAGYRNNDTERFSNQSGRTGTNGVKERSQNGTSEILQLPDGGFLTIDPNSYSTGTPSTKYPHTEMNRQGRLTFNDWQQADMSDLREELKRRTGIDIPGPAEGAAPAPEQGAAPERGATPAPEQGAAPAPAPAPEQEATPAPTPAPEQEATPAPTPAPEQKATPAPTPAPEQEAAPAPEQKASPSGTELSAFETKVVELTNEQRRKNGLKNLVPDTALSNVAQEKSNDMQAKKYFSHTSPTYGSPFDMMRDFGVTYQSAGENIAMGQPTAEEVVNAWMNSEGHRKNILSPNFTHIGVGHTGTGNYWTQMFIGK